MGQTESSATRIWQNVPATGSRFEFQELELEDLARIYGARPATFIPSSISHDTSERDARASAASPGIGCDFGF